MEHLPALARRLGYPGAAKLHLAARQAGLEVTGAQVAHFVQRQGARQIFERLQPSAGKTAAEGPDERYQGDLIDLTGEAREEGGHRYILVLINVFTRELYARPLATKDPASVAPVLEAMLRALPAMPTFLLTDQGAEFKGPVDALLQRLNVVHRDKRPIDVNGLAVLDRAIQELKGRIARLLAAGHHTSWAAALHEAVEGYNESFHSAVHGAPHDVGGTPVLSFMAYQDNAGKLQHNQRLAQGRLARLQSMGAFRRPGRPEKLRQRGFHARFGPLETVGRVEGTTVTSAQRPNEPIDVKHLRPVPADSTEATAVLARGSGLVERKREQVEGVAQALKRLVARRPLTMAAAPTALRTKVPEYDATLRAAHLNLAGLVRLFPEALELVLGPGEATVRRRA
jgi:hypothetical protein